MIFLNEIGNTLKYTSGSSSVASVDIYIFTGNGVPPINKIYPDTPGKETSTGVFEWFDAEAIVRAYMENYSLTTLQIGVNRVCRNSSGEIIGQAVVNFYTVLYINSELIITGFTPTADNFVSRRFLTTQKIGWITPGLTPHINLYCTNGEQVVLIYKNQSGVTVDSDVITSRGGLTYIEIFSEEEWSSVEITAGSRIYKLILVESTDVNIFTFLNNFNCTELVSIPSSVIEEPKTEFEIAQINEVQSQYDIEHKIEFKLNSGNLPAFMYETILAMCRAKDVRIREGYFWRKIIITEYKLPRSTNPNTSISLEIKYQYADINLNRAVYID